MVSLFFHENIRCRYSLEAPHRGASNGCHNIYFIVSGEISVHLVKIKVVLITSELISYHFTSD